MTGELIQILNSGGSVIVDASERGLRFDDLMLLAKAAAAAPLPVTVTVRNPMPALPTYDELRKLAETAAGRIVFDMSRHYIPA